MQLRSGVPLISDLDALLRDPYYSQITGYSRDFLTKHAEALKGYGRLWGQDPFMLWSRRWEYPFVAQKTIDYGKTHRIFKNSRWWLWSDLLSLFCLRSSSRSAR